MEVLGRLQKWVMQLTEIGLALVALGIVMQLLFGNNVLFITGNMTGNIIALIGQLGAAGVVGLVAIAIIVWLFSKRA